MNIRRLLQTMTSINSRIQTKNNIHFVVQGLPNFFTSSALLSKDMLIFRRKWIFLHSIMKIISNITSKTSNSFTKTLHSMQGLGMIFGVSLRAWVTWPFINRILFLNEMKNIRIRNVSMTHGMCTSSRKIRAYAEHLHRILIHLKCERSME